MTELARQAVNDEHAAQQTQELAAFGAYLLTPSIVRPSGEPNPLRTIVEIGSYQGGTLWFWRRLAPEAKIVSVDLHIDCAGCAHRRAHSDCPRARVRQNADVVIEADSRAPGTIADVAREVGAARLIDGAGVLADGAGIDLLFIDGDHSFEAVEADFQNYAPMLSGSGVVALHDITAPALTLPDGDEPHDGAVKLWHNLSKMIPQAFAIQHGAWGGIGVIPKP